MTTALGEGCDHRGYSMWKDSTVVWCALCGATLLSPEKVSRTKGELVGDDSLGLLAPLAGSTVDNRSTSVSGLAVMGGSRLKTIYLAHPYEERELGRGAQRTLAREGFLVINPFERPEQAEYERALAGKGLTKDQCDRIVGGDLAKIDESALL